MFTIIGCSCVGSGGCGLWDKYNFDKDYTEVENDRLHNSKPKVYCELIGAVTLIGGGCCSITLDLVLAVGAVAIGILGALSIIHMPIGAYISLIAVGGSASLLINLPTIIFIAKHCISDLIDNYKA